MRRAIVFVLLAGCGGAPFETDASDLDAGVARLDVAVADAGFSEAAASPPRDARPREGAATPPEAAPADLPDACAPVVAPAAPPDGGSVFAGCVVNASPSSVIPAFYALVLAQGCTLERTPLACQCAATYSCACLKANTTICENPSCDESGGAPTVSCK